jgi:hypothetical protein
MGLLWTAEEKVLVPMVPWLILAKGDEPFLPWIV